MVSPWPRARPVAARISAKTGLPGIGCRYRVGCVACCRHMDGQEATMLKELLGPGLVLVFAVSQAFRDVYFANVFQGIDFFLVIALAFSISTVIFAAVTAIREPAVLAKLRAELPALMWI